MDSLDTWPPENCPALAWPHLPDASARRAWYHAVLAAYAALWDRPLLAPVSDAALDALEADLGCALPPALRAYQQEFGALELAERLCSATGESPAIEPLLQAYPGIVEMQVYEQQRPLLESLVAFGDYLGNGNLWCFERDSGALFYFDHDSQPTLTRFSDDLQDYFDALMLLCLAEVHDDDDSAEALLIERFGEDRLRTWRY
ncbi:MAG: hypothetical protein GAK43_01081 [Stenotrophomonas maltophilia]|nr:MAG: hypothetical protein GAK43_01081 [Stenotrophomonas maltophilia]